MENVAPFILAPCLVLFYLFWVHPFVKKALRQSRISKQPFPKEWRGILTKRVHFYQLLDTAQRVRFERRVQLFLGFTTIVPVKCEIDDTDRVLIGAGAVIPVFGFDSWNYDNLDEVLVYPDAFTLDFRTEGKNRRILGMVGEGAMSGRMILSKKALRHGFANNQDRRNVAIHEFVHLIDMVDGHTDGVLDVLKHDHFVEPWLELMRTKMLEIKRRKSDIRAYGGTHPREFLAVVSEYFFERPDRLKREHPEIYRSLRKYYRQDPIALRRMAQKRLIKKSAGSDPCYCGSNRKFIHCHGQKYR